MHYLIAITVFILSFSPHLSVLSLVLMFVLAIIRLIRKPFLIKKNYSKSTLLFLLLYLLHIIGLLYSSNINEGLVDLQTKLGLIIIPFIFLAIDRISQREFSLYSYAFILGCTIGCISGFYHATSLYFEKGYTDYLYSGYFSFFIPSNYYSIYLLTALVLIWHLTKTNNYSWLSKCLHITPIIILIIGVILTASRASFLAIILIGILWVGYQLIYGENWKNRLLSSCIILSIISAIYFIPFTPFKRFKNITTELLEDNKGSTEKSASIRMQVWKASIDVISKNFLFGVGTGDIEVSLQNAYKERNITHAIKRSFNAHNQYLQSFIALGLTGFLLIFSIFFNAAYNALVYKQLPYFLLIFPWFIFAFTESMLERHFGVLLFTFLYFIWANYFIPKKC